MSIDFSVTTMSQMAGGATASAASSLATGSLMGNAAAQVEDPMSLLADAAEELTFAADTTDEYELEDRKERERAESAYAERVKLYQDLMHEAGKSQNIDRLEGQPARPRRPGKGLTGGALPLSGPERRLCRPFRGA